MVADIGLYTQTKEENINIANVKRDQKYVSRSMLVKAALFCPPLTPKNKRWFICVWTRVLKDFTHEKRTQNQNKTQSKRTERDKTKYTDR